MRICSSCISSHRLVRFGQFISLSHWHVLETIMNVIPYLQEAQKSFTSDHIERNLIYFKDIPLPHGTMESGKLNLRCVSFTEICDQSELAIRMVWTFAVLIRHIWRVPNTGELQTILTRTSHVFLPNFL